MFTIVPNIQPDGISRQQLQQFNHDSQVFNPTITKSLESNEFRFDKKGMRSY